MFRSHFWNGPGIERKYARRITVLELADAGKASTCHTERRKAKRERERKERQPLCLCQLRGVVA
jgi:hypothetical protein